MRPARGDRGGPAGLGLLIGVLIYDAAVAGLLVYAALFLGMAGVALWPAVVAHAALAVWCVELSAGHSPRRRARPNGGPRLGCAEGSNADHCASGATSFAGRQAGR